jgi:hypothetical protein
MTTAVNDFLGDDAFSTQATIPGQGPRRGRNRARRAPRTWDGRKHQGTPRIQGTAYDVSPADARCESLGSAAGLKRRVRDRLFRNRNHQNPPDPLRFVFDDDGQPVYGTSAYIDEPEIVIP